MNLLGEPFPSLFKPVELQSTKHKNGECLKLKRVRPDLKALVQGQLFLLALILSLSTLKVGTFISTPRCSGGQLCSIWRNSMHQCAPTPSEGESLHYSFQSTDRALEVPKSEPPKTLAP